MIVGVGLNKNWIDQDTSQNLSIVLSNMISLAAKNLQDEVDAFGNPLILFVLETMVNRYKTPVEKIIYLASEIVDCVNYSDFRQAGLTDLMLYVVNLLRYNENTDDFMDYINKIASNRLAIQVKVGKLEAVDDQLRRYANYHQLSESDMALNAQYGIAAMMLKRQLMGYRKMDQVDPTVYEKGFGLNYDSFGNEWN